MMLMDLQATATHLAIAVESLSCVELFRHLSYDYSPVALIFIHLYADIKIFMLLINNSS